jgi:hypothetical protein
MDPYKVLGVERTAVRSQIEAAYREKALKYHPDRGGDAWAFEQVQRAYEALTNRNGSGSTFDDKQPAHDDRDSPGDPRDDTSYYSWDDKQNPAIAKPEEPTPRAAMLAAGGLLGGVVAAIVALVLELPVTYGAALGVGAGVVFAQLFVPKQSTN